MKYASKEIDGISNLLKRKNNLNLKVLKYFLADLNISIENKNLHLIYIVNSIPIPDESCNEQLKSRKQALSNLNYIFNENNINFVDFNYLIKDKFGSLSNSELKYGGGHLNYLGHKIYSDVWYKHL